MKTARQISEPVASTRQRRAAVSLADRRRFNNLRRFCIDPKNHAGNVAVWNASPVVLLAIGQSSPGDNSAQVAGLARGLFNKKVEVMVNVIVEDRLGETSRVRASPDISMSLMEVIRNDSSMSLEAICGGMMSCSTCHVYIDPLWMDRIGPTSDEERELLLDSPFYQANSRLSCQILITAACDGLRAVIAPAD